MGEKVTTIMKLKVDLQCSKCYKKVKKVLCKFPQIRDQVYDEKNNIVTITVVCCSPEKIRDKLCCKACGAIKSIEIVEPPKPKPPEKPKEPPKPKEPEKPKEPPKPKEPEKPKEPPKPKEPEKPKEKPPPPPQPKPEPPPPPVPVCPPPPQAPPPMAVPIGVCCGACYEGRAGGPCFEGYGGYGGGAGAWYGRPVYDSYGGGGRPCYVSRCDEYFCEENTSACSIM